MPRKRHRKSRGGALRLILVAAAIVVILVLFAGSRHWLSIDSLRQHRDALQQYVDAHYWRSLFLLAAATVTLIGASVPISPALMLVSGMVFGRWVGSVVMVIAASLGAALAMLVVRHMAQDFVRARVRRHPKARRMVASFRKHQGSYLLFLRFAPGFPFWLANVLYGLTDIPAWRFLLLTLVGIVPDVIVYSNVGANLAHVKSAHDLLSPGIIAALAFLAILSLVPVLVRELQRRKLSHSRRPSHRN
jgi:uncharacterized membrane protein YdjX (TVP38/TMEM64 family)